MDDEKNGKPHGTIGKKMSNTFCVLVNGTEPPRQEQLETWFRLNHMTKAEAARKIGMSKQLFHLVIGGERMTKERHKLCTDVLEIPAHLLPEPRELKRPGPKAKPESQGDAA